MAKKSTPAKPHPSTPKQELSPALGQAVNFNVSDMQKVPNADLLCYWVDAMKISVRGDIPIAQLTFAVILPEGIKDIVCLQTPVAHIARIAEVLGSAAKQAPSLAAVHVGFETANLKNPSKKVTKKQPKNPA